MAEVVIAYLKHYKTRSKYL